MMVSKMNLIFLVLKNLIGFLNHGNISKHLKIPEKNLEIACDMTSADKIFRALENIFRNFKKWLWLYKNKKNIQIHLENSQNILIGINMF